MTEEKLSNYLKRANEIHNHFYDYSKVNPQTVKEKTIIICPIHGEFITTLDSHISKKSGCPKCKNVQKYTNEEWIEKADAIHEHKYDYSKTHYTKAKEKVCIICHEKDALGNEHGEFYIRAGNHIAGIGCPKCGGKYFMTQDEFVNKSKFIHGNKYDYSNVKFDGTKNKVEIICHEKDALGNEHGPFIQNASSHLSGCGCPKCNKGITQTKDEFIAKSIVVHNNKYDYSKVEYKTAKSKVEIICPIHGVFLQTPDQHVRGQGCPKCKSSLMESEIITILNNLHVYYESQSKIINMGNQTIDFYLPDLKIAIECQGEQHFVPTRFSKTISFDEANSIFEKRIYLDKQKYDRLNELGCEMIYYINKKHFSKKSIKTDSEFYKDKICFYNLYELENYLKNKIIKNRLIENTIKKDFYRTLCEIYQYGIIRGDVFFNCNYGIFYQKLEKTPKRKLYDMQRNYNNNNKQLIIVFEDEWINHRDIVLSKIRHILGADKERIKIGARKCIVREITNDESKRFLEKWHIQGFGKSTIYYGAYYNDVLVGVMSFKYSEDEWELTRFATNGDYSVPGLGGKIFKRFLDDKNPSYVKSFADRRWTLDKDNNLYTKVGFKIEGICKPDYRYVVGNERKHKFGFRKQILHKKYGVPLEWTEKEMCDTLGFYRIWDCGLVKYVWKHE